MRLKSGKRMTRKTAVAAVVLGATLVLPGSAVADHNPNNTRNPYTCDPSITDTTDPNSCPAFETTFAVRVQNPVKNQQSAVQFQFGQPDRRMPVMRADYYLPTGWRFGGLSTLRPAVQADGVTPATACSQIHETNGQLRNAELLSADTGMLVHLDSRREDDPDDIGEAGEAVEDPVAGEDGLFLAPFDQGPREYGVRNPGGTTEGSRFPSVSFLSWNPTGGPDGAGEAQLCYYHRNNPINAAAREFHQPATLSRLTSDPNYDWKFSIDVSSVMKNSYIAGERGSVLEHHVALGGMTAGNWHRHPVTNEFQKVPFSRTPLLADNYPFRADFHTCAEGLSTTGTGCINDTFVSQTLTKIVSITPAPDTQTFDFGKLTGPGTPELCNNAACPLGLIRGASEIGVSWNQPALVDGQEVLGYALTIAIPGNQASRKFYRLVTDPDAPGFDASVCGPAGGNPGCSFEIDLPVQSTDGSTTLTPDRKYHIALVTIYSDGRRTDLKCDEATGAGATCPGSTPRMKLIAESGISTWQVLMRSEEWPRAFVMTLDDSSNATHDPITNYLLLLDCNRKEGEFVIWNTNDSVSSFRARSNLILCANDPGTPGLLHMNNGTSAGATRNWTVTAEIEPADPTGVFFGAGATGTFLSYNVKNPGLNPPSLGGWPEIGQPGCNTVDPTGITTIISDTRPCIWFLAVEI